MMDFGFTRGLVIGTCLGIFLLLLSHSCAKAHTSKGGQEYDASCCGGHDCRELEDSKVGLELSPIAGGWLVIPTSEHFFTADRSHVKVSTDGHYHRCSAEGGAVGARTYCLYIPQEV